MPSYGVLQQEMLWVVVVVVPVSPWTPAMLATLQLQNAFSAIPVTPTNRAQMALLQSKINIAASILVALNQYWPAPPPGYPDVQVTNIGLAGFQIGINAVFQMIQAANEIRILLTVLGQVPNPLASYTLTVLSYNQLQQAYNTLLDMNTQYVRPRFGPS